MGFNVIRLTYQGRTMTVSEWAKELNLPLGPLRNRIQIGMSAEEALTKPFGGGRQQINIPPSKRKANSA